MSSRSFFRRGRALTALLCLSVLGSAVAQETDNGDNSGSVDPPSRVARLSFTKGSVSMQPAGTQDWAEAMINRPLTSGDKIWSDQDSRAELDMGTAAIRLGSSTGFSFLNLNDQVAQMNVTAGTVIVHVRDVSQNQTLEIDTPNLAVTLQSPGDYRVEVNDAGDATLVKVSDGDALATSPGQSVPIHTQQAVSFTGTDQVTADTAQMGAPDALDSWSLDRDRQTEQAESNQYVAPEVAGTQDLDDYGTWSSTPEYGNVWTPTAVAAGWAPYHFGRWVWVSPWGWTWVDAAPWGFAPFHYGRWAYLGARWCWVPGPPRIRPVYAPALVGWVGGAAVGASFVVGGAPSVGWFPLGPREVYVPGYHVSQTYVRNVNISNTTIINNTYITNVYRHRETNITYVNRNVPGAVTAVPQAVFTSARPISGHTMRLSEGELSRLTSRVTVPAIAPARQSVLGEAPGVSVRQPPRALLNRPVVARTAPPPAPVPFDRMQDAIRANGGRPLAHAQLAALQPRTLPQQRVRIVTPAPGQSALRPSPNGRQVGGAPGFDQGRDQQPSWQDRERAMHATPIPARPSVQPNTAPAEQQKGFRNDRPPQFQSPRQNDPRQNDLYRAPPNNNASRSEFRSPEDRPSEQLQARPIEQSRPQQEARPVEPQRPPQERFTPPYQQPQSAPQQRQVQPEPPRAMPAMPMPRPAPQERPAAQPRAPQPPMRNDERRDRPSRDPRR